VLVVRDWVVRFSGEDEICGNELGALVQQLVEGVLGIGGRLAKEDPKRMGPVVYLTKVLPVRDTAFPLDSMESCCR
jgi:hypothetical protein